MVENDIAQELLDCLELSVKNFKEKSTPRTSELKRIRAAIVAGKAALAPIYCYVTVEEPKVEKFKTVLVTCHSLPPRI